MPSCQRHPEQSTVAQCESCHRDICTTCMSSAFALPTCRDCATQKQAAQKRGRLVLGVVAIPVVLGLGYGLFVLAGQFSPEAQAARKANERAAIADAEATAEAERLLTDLRKAPCSRQAAVPALERLLKAKRADAVLTEAARFEQECGPWPRLWWLTYAAYEQRGEFEAAAGEATKLINDNPDDRDFWWWRARAYFNKGDFEKAEPDYRQVREICPTCLVGWATADTLEKLNRPCDAIAPLVQSLVMHPDLRNGDEVRRRIDRLRALPTCLPMEGTGTLRLPLTNGHAYAAGSVNGARVEFLVDTGATTVAVSEKMAAAMKLTELPALKVRSNTANGLVEGRQVIAERVEVGPLVATDVPVIILPHLEGTALLGMSFVGRFDVDIDARHLTLSARGARPTTP